MGYNSSVAYGSPAITQDNEKWRKKLKAFQPLSKPHANNYNHEEE